MLSKLGTLGTCEDNFPPLPPNRSKRLTFRLSILVSACQFRHQTATETTLNVRVRFSLVSSRQNGPGFWTAGAVLLPCDDLFWACHKTVRHHNIRRGGSYLGDCRSRRIKREPFVNSNASVPIGLNRTCPASAIRPGLSSSLLGFSKCALKSTAPEFALCG